MFITSHGWSISARAHVHTALLHLRNGLTDCVYIWYVGWGSLSRYVSWGSLSTSHGWGGASLHVRTYTPSSPYFKIRLTIFAKIWYVARDPIVTIRDLQKWEVGWLHIRTCVSSFVVSETAQPRHWSDTKNRLISFGFARSSPNMASSGRRPLGEGLSARWRNHRRI